MVFRRCVALSSRLLSTSTQLGVSKVRNPFETPYDGMGAWAISAAVPGSGPASVSGAPVDLSQIAKSPRDSMFNLFLPFKSRPELLEQYVNSVGQIRIARLMEDLDLTAGNIAYMHTDDGNPDTPHLTLVTASCDRIDVLGRITPEKDLMMRGCCTYVGRSSMNIDIDVMTVPESTTAQPEVVIFASFTFVARHGTNAVAVPTIKSTDEQEKEWFLAGKLASQARKAQRSVSLYLLPPTAEESSVVHKLLMGRPANGTLIVGPSSTVRSSLLLTMPQDRNIHGKVFGGFLMRQACELAWATGYAFSKERPAFVALDDITFVHPVEVGDLLSYTARVTYTEGHVYGVSVSADVLNPEKGTLDRTNEFRFVFKAKWDTVLPEVLPHSYMEAMEYLQAQRRHRAGVMYRAQIKSRGTRFPLPPKFTRPY